jgi:dimethylaniline monooxygenase (N-oxide forming)
MRTKLTGFHCLILWSFCIEYAKKFDLLSCIQFGTKVQYVQRTADGRYSITVTDCNNTLQKLQFDAVAICSGLHNVPRTPCFKGIDTFTGTVLHSSLYKDKSAFKDKKVLIIGAGVSLTRIATFQCMMKLVAGVTYG